MHNFTSVTRILPSMAVIMIAVPCCQHSCVTYVFRPCDLLVLKIIIPNQCHAKKLKIKKKSFTHWHSSGLVMKVK